MLSKYQSVLRYCQKEKFDSGIQIYQNIELIISLRNEIMHYKPQSFGGEIQHKFLDKLKGKFSENPLMIGSNNPYFPDRCLGSNCADWAITSTQKLADAFFLKLSIIPNYQLAKF